MAKNLTSFVTGIGLAGGVDRSAGVWEYFNERCNQYACGSSSDDTQIAWCVPVGVTSARFELWGAGGQPGGSAACCGISAPSSAGAYAYKTIPVTAGDCYTVYAGIMWCATSCRCPNQHRIDQGFDCCQYFNTWVTGTGLTNFCANKGQDSCYIVCSDYATTGVGNVDSDTTFLWNDSENAPQACYYGADGGERGYNGYTFTSNQGNPASTGEYCTWRMAIPYPGGLITQKPGRTIGYMCCHQSGCSGNGSFSSTFEYGNNVCWGAFKAGAGNAPTISCGGNSNCAWINQGGLVRITYK
jgi:hypothetical protein|tara:strand:- start:10276 stop:11172 length:897 start_codon:yes stop_codon:yes gene_type:complete